MRADMLKIIATRRMTTAAAARTTGGDTAVGVAPSSEAEVACEEVDPAMTVSGTLEVAVVAMGGGVEAVCRAASSSSAAVGVAGAEVREERCGEVGRIDMKGTVELGQVFTAMPRSRCAANAGSWRGKHTKLAAACR